MVGHKKGSQLDRGWLISAMMDECQALWEFELGEDEGLVALEIRVPRGEF